MLHWTQRGKSLVPTGLKPLQRMFLQRLPLRLLGQRHVERSRGQVRVSQRLLDGLEVGAAGDVVGRHRVSQAVDGGPMYAGLGQVLGNKRLNGAFAERPAEL